VAEKKIHSFVKILGAQGVPGHSSIQSPDLFELCSNVFGIMWWGKMGQYLHLWVNQKDGTGMAYQIIAGSTLRLDYVTGTKLAGKIVDLLFFTGDTHECLVEVRHIPG